MCLSAPRRRAPPPAQNGKSSFSSSGSSAGSDPPPSPRKHRRRGSIAASRSSDLPIRVAKVPPGQPLRTSAPPPTRNSSTKKRSRGGGGSNIVASAESAVVDERAGHIKISPSEPNDRAWGKVANNVYPVNKEYPYPKSDEATLVVTTQIFFFAK
ncbi:hypothetical protein C7212DRAFT_343967 [Tuber magnatum]|uniref:Uncharacterized protein n=1 Tax=Tuber magnatum TaxID=42249 RepID=A0A317ST61_9PEZI|nr:hypothetical protein C7212DRAFT_343967 [Tuber magnatum]